MIHSVGRERDPLHEPECLSEIFKFEQAVQISLYHAPAIELVQPRRNFLLRKLYSACRTEQNRKMGLRSSLISISSEKMWRSVSLNCAI